MSGRVQSCSSEGASRAASSLLSLHQRRWALPRMRLQPRRASSPQGVLDRPSDPEVETACRGCTRPTTWKSRRGTASPRCSTTTKPPTGGTWPYRAAACGQDLVAGEQGVSSRGQPAAGRPHRSRASNRLVRVSFRLRLGPLLHQPANPPLLRWNPVNGATSYEVEIDTAERDWVETKTYNTDHFARRSRPPGGGKYWWRSAPSWRLPLDQGLGSSPDVVGALPEFGDEATPDAASVVQDVVFDWKPVRAVRSPTRSASAPTTRSTRSSTSELSRARATHLSPPTTTRTTGGRFAHGTSSGWRRSGTTSRFASSSGA